MSYKIQLFLSINVYFNVTNYTNRMIILKLKRRLKYQQLLPLHVLIADLFFGFSIFYFRLPTPGLFHFAFLAPQLGQH